MWKSIFLVFIVLFTSCVNLNGVDPEAQIERPVDLIESDKMIQLMTEIAVIEGAYAVRYVQLVRYADQMAKDIESYLESQGVTPEQYKSAVYYYSTQSSRWVEMQEKVKKKLEIQLNELPVIEQNGLQEATETIEIEAEP